MDVTGRRFDVVDMEYCNIWFSMPRQLGEVLTIEFSKLLLRTAENAFEIAGATEELGFDPNECNVFVFGTAVLAVKNPVALDVDVSLYDTAHDKPTFIYGANADIIRLRRSLSRLDDCDQSTEYDAGGRLIWPHGDCAMTFRTHSSVILEFPPSACISAVEFGANQSKWLST
jgi:hypothetical protein